MRWGSGLLVAGLMLTASALSSCSLTRGAPDAGATTSGAPATTPPPYSAGPTPSGTAPTTSTSAAVPTQLDFGAAATVPWRPKQGVDGTVRLKVTGIYEASFDHPEFKGWQIDKNTRTTRPYFVNATVTNAGHGDLGGFPVPLYGLDDHNDLVQASTFGKATFAPCHPSVLPTPFGPGKSVRACLVILVPDKGHLLGASFRPDEQDAPITWHGAIKPFHVKK